MIDIVEVEQPLRGRS